MSLRKWTGFYIRKSDLELESDVQSQREEAKNPLLFFKGLILGLILSFLMWGLIIRGIIWLFF